jgi:hypothetical protein
MTRQQQYVRAAITMAGVTLFVLVVSARPASAEYRAWYAPYEDHGLFEEGDVSEGTSTMIPPVGACGLRVISPNSYAWIGSDLNVVEDDDGVHSGTPALDVIIWVDAPNCSRSFSVAESNGTDPLELPDVGAVYIALDAAEGAYWVNDEGCYLNGCGGVEPASEDEATAPSDSWSLAMGWAFKAVSAGVVDPRRQPRAVIAIATLSRQTAQLQPLLQQQIVERRRLPLGVIEASVRSLEDAAARALYAARSSVATCEARVRLRAYTDAFVACTIAGQHLEDSGSLARAAWFLAQPAK